MKKALSALLLVGLIFLSGCSAVGFNNKDTMRPPRATGDKAEIQSVIESKAQGDYTLKYPQNGDYRSAIITYDLDNDAQEEALAFFCPAGDEITGIRLLVIDEIDGAWQAVGDFTGSAAEADRVIITDMNSDGMCEILVGFSQYSNPSKLLSAYSFSNAGVNELVVDEAYNDIVVSDLNDDGRLEIILLSLASSEVSASARLLKMGESGNTLYSVSSVQMNSDVTKYLNIMTDKIGSGEKAVIFDGLLVNNSLTTQVILLRDENTLANPLYAPDSDNYYSEDTLIRPGSILSTDIDSDGVVEIPTPIKMHTDLNGTNEAACSAYSFCTLENGISLTEENIAVTDPENNYWFIIPLNWGKGFSAIYNSDEKSTSFYSLDEKLSKGDRILKFCCFDKAAWQKENSEYIEIYSDDTTVYAYRSFCEESDSMYLSQNQIKSNFISVNN